MCYHFKFLVMSDALTLSYLTQRKVIGWLGILLPVLCLLSCLSIEERPDEWYYSLSATYHLSPVLTMMLSCSAIFLMTYQGYDKSDQIINIISGILALGVIFFSCNTVWLDPNSQFGLFQLNPGTSHIIHCICAGLLFFFFSLNILMQFTKGNGATKKLIFRICGWGMIVCLVFFLLAELFKFLPGYFTMIFEAILLILFGIAWLVKGKTFNLD